MCTETYPVYTPAQLPPEWQTLRLKAREVALKAYAPYSQFCVGAALQLEDGQIFTGNNQENAAYGDSLCAERVCLLYATANHPNIAPQALAITAFYHGAYTREPIPPCGSCRQVLHEMEQRFHRPIPILLCGDTQCYLFPGIATLLPLQFGEAQLSI